MMAVCAETLAIFLFCETACQGINSRFIHAIDVHEGVADFVGRVGELQNDVFCAARDSLEVESEPIAAQNREYETDFSFREKPTRIFSDIVGRMLIQPVLPQTCDGNDIAIMQLKTFVFAASKTLSTVISIRGSPPL